MNLIKCGLIGYGSWATALSHILQSNGVHVFWHVSNHLVADSLVAKGKNYKYLSELSFDPSLMSVTSDIDSVIENCDDIILCIPSAYIASTLEKSTADLCSKRIISATKGLIAESSTRVTEYLYRKHGVPLSSLFVLSGPSHAEEVAKGKHTFLTLAGMDLNACAELSSMFEASSVSVNISVDVAGIEVAGVLKNIYAVAVGLVSGLGYGENFKSAFISFCSNEMFYFLRSYSPTFSDFLSPVYLGDLLVTCYSSLSRNYRFGFLIGEGHSVESVLLDSLMVAEGYFSAASFIRLKESLGVCMPICQTVYDILYCECDVRSSFDSLCHLLSDSSANCSGF